MIQKLKVYTSWDFLFNAPFLRQKSLFSVDNNEIYLFGIALLGESNDITRFGKRMRFFCSRLFCIAAEPFLNINLA